MKFDINIFRQAHQENVQKLYKKDGINAISFYCAVSFCPVIAAYCFCKEVDPDNKELDRRIKNNMTFYSVESIIK